MSGQYGCQESRWSGSRQSCSHLSSEIRRITIGSRVYAVQFGALFLRQRSVLLWPSVCGFASVSVEAAYGSLPLLPILSHHASPRYAAGQGLTGGHGCWRASAGRLRAYVLVE